MHDTNEQNKQVRCGIYARNATANPTAIARQIASCKQIAQEHGWAIDDRYVYRDDGLGGLKTVGRPALEQLLAALQQPGCPIGLLLVEEASRLGRDLQVIVEILQALTGCGVRVYAAKTKLELSSPTGNQLLRTTHLASKSVNGRWSSFLRKVCRQKQ
jgi:DNA invertase Pin-like site-specific DNA recombinase